MHRYFPHTAEDEAQMLGVVGADRVEDLFASIPADCRHPMTMLMVMGSVFVFGVVITFMCAYISINKYLRMKASALYYI